MRLNSTGNLKRIEQLYHLLYPHKTRILVSFTTSIINKEQKADKRTKRVKEQMFSDQKLRYNGKKISKSYFQTDGQNIIE